MRDDHLHGFEQILANEIRLVFPRIALVLPLAQAVATQNKRRAQARISRELDIALAIANHPARTAIDLKLRHRTIDQSRLRLATIAVDAVRRLSDCRMMSAVINRIQMRVF